MPLNPTTPGVSVEEVSTLPSSVVAVDTAVPVFIGYTEKVDASGFTTYPSNPIRIESLLEFQTIFGGPYVESFSVTLTEASVEIEVDRNVITDKEDFRLFYHMQMYFANGGGPCYIISVGDYTGPVSEALLAGALVKAEQQDEITLIVIPETMASVLTDANRKTVNDAALAHCAKLQDRFALLDVPVISTPTDTIAGDADNFRSLNVGANNLNYGAAYYPSFDAALSFAYLNSYVAIDASDTRLPAGVQDFDGEDLDLVLNGVQAAGTVTFASTGTYAGTLRIGPASPTFTLSGTGPSAQANALAAAINASAPHQSLVTAVSNGIDTVKVTALTPGLIGNSIVFTLTGGANVAISAGGTLLGGIDPDKVLYSRIKAALKDFPMELYPSATMAGIYANVDNTRGVWKAPANISVALVDKLSRNIKDDDQSDLNVHASGKSIDAIRVFNGRGILVWGARTLDGNSNDFRYVNVRRTLIMIEESCKKASEFVVFEPNDANTWIRVKGMISNFLTNLWRDGALVGSKPEQAYFVQIGINETMTAQDILEGRMIVRIGVAISHPAEFVILKFEHKLQVS